MNALTGLLLIALGVVLGLPAGYGWCDRDTSKYRRRADWRCEQLLASVEALEVERRQLCEEREVLLDALCSDDSEDIRLWTRELGESA